jgi:DNA-binding CsgD family transcriptional regulator
MNDIHPEQASSLSDPLPLDERSLLLSLGWFSKIAEQADPNAIALICQRVAEITSGYAYIILYNQEHKTVVAPASTLIPITFLERMYGTLVVLADPRSPLVPLVPFQLAQMLALACALAFRTLESNAYLRSQWQHVEQQKPLRGRQQEALQLMCEGYGTEEIAEKMCITPATVRKYRESIYRYFGVDSVEKVSLAAFVSGYFCPVEGLTPLVIPQKQHKAPGKLRERRK